MAPFPWLVPGIGESEILRFAHDDDVSGCEVSPSDGIERAKLRPVIMLFQALFLAIRVYLSEDGGKNKLSFLP